MALGHPFQVHIKYSLEIGLQLHSSRNVSKIMILHEESIQFKFVMIILHNLWSLRMLRLY